MGDCECLPRCPFFNDKMVGLPATAELFKKQYCRSNYLTCARYMVFKALGRERVPADLFPNNEERAKRILTGGA